MTRTTFEENRVYWDGMCKLSSWGVLQATDEYCEKYIDFMLDRKNIGNCLHCPENEGKFPHADRPCGQQNCWVTCHCNAQ